MDRFKLLLVALTISTLVMTFTTVSTANAAADVCTPDDQRMGLCPDGPETGGIANGGSVDLTADATSGSAGSGTVPRQGSSGSDNPAELPVCPGGDPHELGLESLPLGNCTFLPWVSPNILATPCTVCSPDTIVRVSDLQNFPAYPTLTAMEPSGWTIVGLAANFWADASAQLGEGLLLGQPAQVMFTPIGYHWSYGDGTTTSSTTGGASWESLSLAEFATTPTSHVYTDKGTYTVTLTVDYRADYSFGDQGWRPVVGIVTVPSAPFTVLAARESTVLVAEDCNTNPRGPGC